MDKIIIAVDFDGTCTAHNFPAIGADIGAAEVLRELVENGHRLILWTMRSNKLDNINVVTSDTSVYTPKEGERNDYLSQAIQWFLDNDIALYGVQTNPTQSKWTSSPKCYANLYLDDAALGCPLTYDIDISDRPFVNWVEMRELLVARRLLKCLD